MVLRLFSNGPGFTPALRKILPLYQNELMHFLSYPLSHVVAVTLALSGIGDQEAYKDD
jgi:hypothetical protein